MDQIERYYLEQAGGGGNYYIGRYQKGHGIGSLFSALYRTGLPLIKPLIKPLIARGIKAVGQHVLTKATESLVSSSKPKKRKTPKRLTKRRITTSKVKRLI